MKPYQLMQSLKSLHTYSSICFNQGKVIFVLNGQNNFERFSIYFLAVTVKELWYRPWSCGQFACHMSKRSWVHFLLPPAPFLENTQFYQCMIRRLSQRELNNERKQSQLHCLGDLAGSTKPSVGDNQQGVSFLFVTGMSELLFSPETETPTRAASSSCRRTTTTTSTRSMESPASSPTTSPSS